MLILYPKSIIYRTIILFVYHTVCFQVRLSMCSEVKRLSESRKMRNVPQCSLKLLRFVSHTFYWLILLFHCWITSYHELEPKAFGSNMLFHCLQWGISTGRCWHLIPCCCLVFLNILSSQTDKSPNFIVYHAIVTFVHIVCSVRTHQ